MMNYGFGARAYSCIFWGNWYHVNGDKLCR